MFSEVSKRFPAMPFTLRALVEGVDNKDLAKQMRLGMVECLNHQLLQPYPVLHEKSGDLVAQVRWHQWLIRRRDGRTEGTGEREGGEGEAEALRVGTEVQNCDELS